MKAQSTDYIALQNIYKRKARADCAEVLQHVRRLEKETARSPNLIIDEKEVENFCKGAAHLHLVRGKPLLIPSGGEPQQQGHKKSAPAYMFGAEAARALAEDPVMNPMGSLLGLFLAFLAWDEYVATHTTSPPHTGGVGLHIPGTVDTDLDSDTEKLTGIAHRILDSLLHEAGTRMEDPVYSDLQEEMGKVCLELVRSGGGELHNVASLTGGLVAQEVIKVVTGQYVPVSGSCVFDGVASRTQVFGV